MPRFCCPDASERLQKISYRRDKKAFHVPEAVGGATLVPFPLPSDAGVPNRFILEVEEPRITVEGATTTRNGYLVCEHQNDTRMESKVNEPPKAEDVPLPKLPNIGLVRSGEVVLGGNTFH